MRARLENSYNIKRIMDLENEHQHLKNRLKEEDKRAIEIKQITKVQERAIKDFDRCTYSEKKFSDLIKEVNHAKVYDKGLQIKAREN